MATFHFRARDAEGRTQEGQVTAVDAGDGAQRLRQRGLLVLDLREERERPSANLEGLPRTTGGSWLPATSYDVELGFRHLALMHRSGIALVRALDDLEATARRRSMGKVWASVASHIEGGSSFAGALERHPRRFHPMLREVVRAGEHSGTLDESLERMADYLERRRTVRANVLRALLYPVIVLVLTLGVATFMVVTVIPTLETFLRGFHRRLPALTVALVDISSWLRAWFPQLCVLSGSTVIGLLALDRWRPTRTMFDRVSYCVPIIGGVRRLHVTSVFARTVGTLLSQGVGIVSALELARGILSRPVSADRIERAERAVLAGESLATALRSHRPFAPLLPRLVAVGERTGELDRTMLELATFQESELERFIARASTLIEPAVTVLVGTVVGFVYLAFFLAIFAIAGGPA